MKESLEIVSLGDTRNTSYHGSLGEREVRTEFCFIHCSINISGTKYIVSLLHGRALL